MQNKYPLWKNIALILGAVIAVVYAIPSLYGEDPAIQISAQALAHPVASLQTEVSRLLEEAHIPMIAIHEQGDALDVRFSSTDIQLHAKDVIQKGLGSDYTVALNLLPATPAWLTKIYAEPIKRGLDLQGGVHFLLEVDIQSVVKRRYEGLIKGFAEELRGAGIRYSGMRVTVKTERDDIENQVLELIFRSTALRDQALTLLKQKYADLVFMEDTNSPVFNVRLTAQELNTIRQNTIEQTITILRNRVNELGVGEAVVQQQGLTRVAVDLPGIQDAARAHQILGGTATLQFHLVDAEHDPIIAKQTGVVPVGSQLYTMGGMPILLKRQVVLNGDSITSAVSSFDQDTASPAVQIQLGGGGETFFTKVTRENIGRRLAIVYIESKTELAQDGENKHVVTSSTERVISAPVINSVLGTHFQITGMADSKEASNLALLLRAGALPTVIYPIEEKTVGPSLGKENIRRGIVSLEVGMGFILMIMVVYYRIFGWIANVALFLNLVFLCSLLSMLGATLTLPGIAAMVLTVGMAVDANVLINERIREELRAGCSPQMAIHAGYERAFATIMDANITTFIVTVVLFSIGTGPIRGFAITLSLGLLTSVLTGVTYTRAMVNLIYGRRQVKKLSIGMQEK